MSWTVKPWNWRSIQGLADRKIDQLAQKIPPWFQQAALKYLAGPPYEDAIYVDRTFTWTLDKKRN